MLENASPDILVAIIAGSATIFASVLVLVISRYYQTKHEQLIAHQEKKVELYNEFLVQLFELFAADPKKKIDPDKLTPILRETQRKLILWGGPNVITAYSDWHKILAIKPPRALHVIKMIDFFLALRKDLGHSNTGIQYEHLIRFLYSDAELFMREYTKNPDITLEEIAEAATKLEHTISK